MNIDLLIGKHGQSGLLGNAMLAADPLGAIYDAQTRELIIEFDNGIPPFHLNIPVEERFAEKLLRDHGLFIAIVQNKEIVQSLEVPLVYLNDPYGGKFNDRPIMKTHSAIIGFEDFMQKSSFAQPIHRDDLGDENTLSGILDGEDVRTLKFSPALIRQRDLEKAMPYMPAAAPGMNLGGNSTIRGRIKDGGETGNY